MESGRFLRKIDAASAAYLTFMRRRLQLYALMYADRTLASNAAVREAERDVFATFQSSLLNDDRVPAERVEEISLVCWVLGRGIASVMLAHGEREGPVAECLAEKILSGFAFLLSPQFVA